MLNRIKKSTARLRKKVLGNNVGGKKSAPHLAVDDPSLFADAISAGLFDPVWYQQQHKIYFSSAEDAFADYLRKSAFSNVAPSSAFDPVSYFHNNPDVYTAGMSPLRHFLRFGLAEGRSAYPLRPLWRSRENLDVAKIPFKREGRYAVVLHIFYADFISRFHNAFMGVDFNFDLFITTTSREVAEKAEIVFRANPSVQSVYVKTVPNQGRNFGPFLVEFAEKLRDYDFFCHMHSKKSLYSGSEQVHWAEYLIEYLARDKQILRNALNAFENDPALGIYHPTTFWNMPQWTCHWLKNKGIGNKLLREWFDIDFHKDYFAYPAGGMFWARVDAVRPLLERSWSYADFPEEPIPADGTVLHAIERVLPVIAQKQGYKNFYYYPASGQFSLDENFIFLEYQYGLDFRMNMLCSQQEICSFDVFDTLVWRKYFVPDYAKFCLPELAGLTLSGSEFVALRNAAELAVREKKKFKGDVTIVEIYEELAAQKIIPSERILEMVDLEFEIDLSMIRPKELMVEFVNRLGGSGKQIYIVTDTYYTRMQIDKLLAVVGIVVPYVLYVSSETGLRKDSGTVWERLSAELKAGGKLKSFVHVGDNVVSDSQIPGDFGIRTIHILAPKDKWQALRMPTLPCDFESLSNIKQMKKWGCLVAVTGHSPFI
ncbi:rhamnan synthesis F family protein [Thalassolituus sp. LLYu03]|uniref:rhamnan synthesis F family protein n=1 Tax=Thalassolituus sp. LLYu03 TaxID=3421656 RepID=UPI003D2AA74A